MNDDQPLNLVFVAIVGYLVIFSHDEPFLVSLLASHHFSTIMVLRQICTGANMIKQQWFIILWELLKIGNPSKWMMYY